MAAQPAMRTAPAFELHLTPGVTERVALALIGGITAAVVAAWVWSHFDAAAGPAGRGAWAWAAATVAAAVPGSWLGWRLAPRGAVTLAWDRGSWTLCRPGGEPVPGGLQARMDLGSWMLMCFAPTDGGRATWLAVSREQAGSGWHALRASLFAP
ncbi:MAG TPA: hypothetical protein VLE94_16735, partial [Burkholderiaceae bacterium]|nr:hypothetical protein [Burkholderiaceae bacterium]